MCNQCIKIEFPERDTVCLENGSYFMNFVGCAECNRKDTLEVRNRIQNEDDDGEEIITYQHVCRECEHTIANHEYRFSVDGEYQTYEMECLLCGRGEDSRSIMPVDPRR